jgi:hypothetical protein
MKYTKKFGGGGGSGGTTENIPEWAQPYIKNVANQAEGMYGAGDLSKVAGASNLQEAAFNKGAGVIGATTGTGLDRLDAQQGRLSGMATVPSPATLAGQKANVLYDAQKGVAGLNTGFGQSGTLGSGRQAVMQGAQNAETVGRLAKVDADYEDAMFKNRLSAEGVLGQSIGGSSDLASKGASGLSALGGQQRTIEQQKLDAPWQGLERYASTIFGSPARQQQTQSGGK